MKSLRVRLLSDIHLELYDLKNISFKKQADIAILAGDIGNPYQDNYKHFLHKISLLHDKVFVITGNHEYYSNEIQNVDNKIKKLCDKLDNTHFLQMDSFIYHRIKFVGCTLWSHPTDNRLSKYMNDFNMISNFSLDKYVSTHIEHKEWLDNELLEKSENYDKICAITHHLPSYSLIDSKYENDPLNSFFASEIDTKGATVWCYGHTHMANHKTIDNVRFYCNPRGYEHEHTNWNIDYIFDL